MINRVSKPLLIIKQKKQKNKRKYHQKQKNKRKNHQKHKNKRKYHQKYQKISKKKIELKLTRQFFII